jgi:hypothetical protein
LSSRRKSSRAADIVDSLAKNDERPPELKIEAARSLLDMGRTDNARALLLQCVGIVKSRYGVGNLSYEPMVRLQRRLDKSGEMQLYRVWIDYYLSTGNSGSAFYVAKMHRSVDRKGAIEDLSHILAHLAKASPSRSKADSLRSFVQGCLEIGETGLAVKAIDIGKSDLNRITTKEDQDDRNQYLDFLGYSYGMTGDREGVMTCLNRKKAENTHFTSESEFCWALASCGDIATAGRYGVHHPVPLFVTGLMMRGKFASALAETLRCQEWENDYPWEFMLLRIRDFQLEQDQLQGIEKVIRASGDDPTGVNILTGVVRYWLDRGDTARAHAAATTMGTAKQQQVGLHTLAMYFIGRQDLKSGRSYVEKIENTALRTEGLLALIETAGSQAEFCGDLLRLTRGLDAEQQAKVSLRMASEIMWEIGLTPEKLEN